MTHFISHSHQVQVDAECCDAFRLPGNSTLEMVLKYQLPGHSMEELIALRTNADLDEFKVCIAFLSNANILTRLYFGCRLLIPLLRTEDCIA